MKKILFLLILPLISLSALAKGVYQKPAVFVNKAFDGEPPPVQVYSYGEADLPVVADILARQVKQGRARYWLQDGRSVWVLQHIGKTKPITAGFIVEDNKIVRTKVLVFKETRGWEIRFKYFTEQFINNRIDESHRLTDSVDNVSGATMSVRAMKKMARLALYLHQQVTDNTALTSTEPKHEEEAPATP